jgi:hypothetical protein
MGRQVGGLVSWQSDQLVGEIGRQRLEYPPYVSGRIDGAVDDGERISEKVGRAQASRTDSSNG